MGAEYFNFALYVGLMLYLIVKKSKATALFIAGIWLFASFVGIFYYNSAIFRYSPHKLELMPFFFLFISFVILITPLINQKKDVQKLEGNLAFVKIISVFYVILGIWPAFRVLIFLIESLISGQFLANSMMYDDVADGFQESRVEKELGYLGIKLLHLIAYFNLLMPIVVYYLYSKGEQKLAFAVFVITMIHPIYAVCYGNRTRLVFVGLYYISIYLFLKNLFTQELDALGKTVADQEHRLQEAAEACRNDQACIAELDEKLKKFIVTSGVSVLLLILSMSFARFVMGSQYGESSLASYLFQYTAEGQYNFNNQGWHNERPLKGDMTLWYFKGLIEDSSRGGFHDRRLSISNKTNIPPHLFYSFPGQLFIDFSFMSLLILAVIAFCFSKIRLRGTIRLSTMYLFGFYLFMTCNSLFYLVYQVYSEFYIALLVGWTALYISEKNYSFINISK